MDSSLIFCKTGDLYVDPSRPIKAGNGGPEIDRGRIAQNPNESRCVNVQMENLGHHLFKGQVDKKVEGHTSPRCRWSSMNVIVAGIVVLQRRV